MKTAILPLLLGILMACGRGPDAPEAPRPIFRQFNTEMTSITLGQSWTAEEVPGAEADDTVVALPAGTFERAQAVRVHRTPEGVVSSIMFDYPQMTDFQAMQTEYTRLFGAPRMHERSGQADAPERLVWQDSVTLFELVRDPKRSASTVYTRLSDLSRAP
jgi:hypothetical protein